MKMLNWTPCPLQAGSNTISMFSINPDHPSQLTAVGDPVPSEGEFPMSLAFNKQGTMLCVLNGGQVNGVNCYKVDPQNGLQAMSGTLPDHASHWTRRVCKPCHLF
jgi:6-phosphogluconolactonase (cycloisomerase 2 family)